MYALNNIHIASPAVKLLAWFFIIIAVTFIPWGLVTGAMETRLSQAFKKQAIYIELFAYLREAYRDVE